MTVWKSLLGNKPETAGLKRARRILLLPLISLWMVWVAFADADWASPDPWALELKRLEAAGIRLQERAEVKGDEGQKTLLANLWQDARGKHAKAHLLRLYGLDGGNLSLLDEVNFGEKEVRFNRMYNLRPLLGGSTPCIVLNWEAGWDCGVCHQLRMFQLIGGKFKALETDLPPINWQEAFPKGIAPKRLEDLDGDGIYELLSKDTRWEYYDELFAREDSPTVWVISRWRDGKYRESSATFSPFYDREILQLRARLPEPEKTEFAQSYQGRFTYEETYLKVSFSIFLNYVQKGAKEEGWKVFQGLIQREKFTIWRSHAQRLIRNLKEKFSL